MIIFLYLKQEVIIVMKKRRSKQEWMSLVSQYMNSGLSMTKWCKENGVSVSSIAPYVKQYATPSEILSDNQNWVEMPLPRNIEKSLITLKVGAVSLDIKEGFDKKVLSDILKVVMSIC